MTVLVRVGDEQQALARRVAEDDQALLLIRVAGVQKGHGEWVVEHSGRLKEGHSVLDEFALRLV